MGVNGTRAHVVVVGAGMAGLTAARGLAATTEVVVVDKGRGVGGRMATRRIGKATLDHGAQFITTHSTEFASVVADWQRHDVVRPWFFGQVGPAGVQADGHARYRGVPGMSAVATHLADGLDVRLGTRVSAVRATPQGWLVQTPDGDLEADAVILTPPVPQTIELLAAGEVPLGRAESAALRAIRYDPCVAALAVLSGDSGLPDPGAVDPAEGPIDWLADNQAKGVSSVVAVTIHGTAEFTRSTWAEPDDRVATDLLDAAGLGPLAIATQVHRWRHARPTVLHPDRWLVAEHPDGAAPLVFAGDAFGGPKVEGAYLSGTAAAQALLRI